MTLLRDLLLLATLAAAGPDGAPAWPAPVDARDDAWTRVNPFPSTGPIKGFFGAAADDVWAWTSWGGIMHWDGRTWSRATQPPQGGEVIAIGTLPAGGVWAELRVQVPEWSSGCEVREAHDETRLWRQTPDGWQALGWTKLPDEETTPERARLDADQLARLWSRHGGGRTVPDGVTMAIAYRVGGRDVWAADREGRWLSRFDGRRWISATNPIWGDADAIWFASETDGWAANSADISHWDGARWTRVHEGLRGARAMWGTAPDDVWLVGDGAPLHWDGTRWNEVTLPKPVALRTISGHAANDLWAAQYCQGPPLHWDGTAWREQSVPDLTLGHWPHPTDCPSVIADGDGRALVMTGQRVLSGKGRPWVETPGPLRGLLRPPNIGGTITAVTTDGAGTTWAVGEQWAGNDSYPVAFRHVAGVWSRSPLPAGTTEIKAIWARGLSDAWIVGTKGLILHFDGRAWNREASGTDETLVAVHGAGRFVWVVGQRGTFLRRKI